MTTKFTEWVRQRAYYIWKEADMPEGFDVDHWLTAEAELVSLVMKTQKEELRKAITIADHQINDLQSFDAVTSEPHQVAGVYFFYKLDCLIDLAHKVSYDFYARPEIFTDLGENSVELQRATIAPILAKLHARYGTDEGVLNKKQRQMIYSALFGACVSMDSSADEEGNFPNLRDELLDACAIFVETKFGDEASLRENVRQKYRLFKQYLTGLLGDSLRWSREQALSALTEQVSYRILRNKGVSAVYAISTPAVGDWPYDFDSNADKLIEEISKQLMRQEKSEEMEMEGEQGTYGYISREEITNRQRTAIEGAKAIATVIDVDAGTSDEEIDRLLIFKCYTWRTALMALLQKQPVIW